MPFSNDVCNISALRYVKNLGVLLDCNMCMEEQINLLSKSAISKFVMLAK